jgi:hypothetical protein
MVSIVVKVFEQMMKSVVSSGTSFKEGRTVLGGVHRLAREERCPPRFDPGSACEIGKQLECGFVYAVLREIEQEAVEFDVKTFEPTRVAEKKSAIVCPAVDCLCASSAARAFSASSHHASPQVIIRRK